MTTTDTDALTEKIRDEVEGIVIGSGYYSTAIGIDGATEVAAAVLPIIAAEVQAAKVSALRSAALDLSFIEMEDDYDRLNYSTSREFYEDMTQDWLRAQAIKHETGDRA